MEQLAIELGNTWDPKILAITLAKCESEDEVIDILKKAKYWDDDTAWREYGDNENNFSVIGNQQSSPDAALVEKLVNSVDAVLMKECLIRNIKPDSKEAPQSIAKALMDFFRIHEGKLSSLDASIRNELAKNIYLVATGKRSIPNYMIIDKGEGQTPNALPNTILSIRESNKIRIPFVQGKFNMGGTGVLQFCGKHNLQLVISKRCEQVRSDDSSKDYWGVTIVRREEPKEGRRSSKYTYLAPDRKVLRFRSDDLPLIPKDGQPYKSPLKSGTFIKLYNYTLSGALATNIVFDLYNRLSLLMPRIALPIRLVECRDYKGHTLETTIAGLGVRLEEDKRQNVEDEFPTSSKIRVNGKPMKVSVYAFKEGQDEKYRKTEGVLFTVNGQTHGNLSKSFFARRAVGLNYIADSILVTVDCSEIDVRTREDLFMNSRDRLREGDWKKQIEKSLEELLKDHPSLRRLKEERRRKALENKIDNSKPLVDILEDVIKKSPTLTKLFVAGSKLSNPFKLENVKPKKNYKGGYFPTYFKLIKPKKIELLEKHVPINMRFRVQFDTDVSNDYFDRDNSPGIFNVFLNENEVQDYLLSLNNGIANLTVTLPKGCKIGEKYEYRVKVSDDNHFEPFIEEFLVIIEKSIKNKRKGPNPREEKPRGKGKEKGEDRKNTPGLNLPKIWDIKSGEWEKYGFDKASVIKVDYDDEKGYEFYINIDNIHLQTEIKGTKNTEKAEYLIARYRYGMALLAISILNYLENHTSESVDEKNTLKIVADTLKMTSPILLPMIESLGSLDEEQSYVTYS